MEIVLYVLAGLAVLALCALAFWMSTRQQGPGPSEPAVPPDPFEAPAAPAPDEPATEPVDERTIEEEMEKEAVEAPEEGELVPAPPPPDVDTLIRRIRSGDPAACRSAIDALCAYGEAALPALERALADPDPDVRIDVQKAIERIRAGD
jgi:hypothetical protein